MNIRKNSAGGYTLIEVVVVIIIIGILGTVAMKSLNVASDTARTVETMAEMELLAHSIAGDPSLVSGGIRTDYGYIGDIGALPPSWDALVSNPGGYATWDGPYIHDEFAAGASNNEFKLDAWGAEYTWTGAVTFSSTGGPDVITRSLAHTTADLLYNPVRLSVTDLDFSPPGPIYKDSVELIITYPDGAGFIISKSSFPDANGYAEMDSIPIGLHTLNVAVLSAGDTLTRKININPGTAYYANIHLYDDIWATGSGSGTQLEFVENSDTLSPAGCFKLSFWIVNNTGMPIDVNSLTLTWTSPTAYYKTVSWNGITVRSGNPALGSGDTANFSSGQIINDGQAVKIGVEQFHRNSNGGGPPVDLTGAQFTVDFSDGSSITFTADYCGL